jgi:hypothetical protein
MTDDSRPPIPGTAFRRQFNRAVPARDFPRPQICRRSAGCPTRRRGNLVQKYGGGGIRTHGTLRPSGFQDRRNRPLCHPSQDALRASGRLKWPSAGDVQVTAADVGCQISCLAEPLVFRIHRGFPWPTNGRWQAAGASGSGCRAMFFLALKQRWPAVLPIAHRESGGLSSEPKCLAR